MRNAQGTFNSTAVKILIQTRRFYFSEKSSRLLTLDELHVSRERLLGLVGLGSLLGGLGLGGGLLGALLLGRSCHLV